MKVKKFTGTVLSRDLKGLSLLFCLLLLISLLFGCTPVSYPDDKVQQAIQEIASAEYNLHDIKVEFAGATLGVYLPLDHLFAADFKEAIMSGKATNMETLFQPTEAAIDKVENMLLSMSRVMLSTDKKIEFYYLQATDVEKTGMELAFIGHIEDVKRVRFWDIPRSEYRKRVIHDLRLNRAALWHRPIRRFFQDLNTTVAADIQTRYFPHTAEAKWTKEFLFTDARGTAITKGRAKWHVLDLRSISLDDNQVVTYAKVEMSSRNEKQPEFSPQTREYLFQVATVKGEEKIRRVIPMAYLDDKKLNPHLTFTRAMLYKSLPSWDAEFKTPDLTMGEFLALQLSRRLQQAAAEDERIYNTLANVKLIFHFKAKPEPFFSFNSLASLRDLKQKAYSKEKGIHEDILYLWTSAARELVEVARSYGFQGYQFLQFQLSDHGAQANWKASRGDLELFRRHKKDLKNILILS